MVTKKSKILIVTVIFLLILSLSACNLFGSSEGDNNDNDNPNGVSQKIFSSSLHGSSFRLVVFSDLKFELEAVEKKGIETEFRLFKGSYTIQDNAYNLTISSGDYKYSTFGKLYEEDVVSAEEIAETNNYMLKANILNDTTCSFLGRILFLDGVVGSYDNVLATTSMSKLMGFTFGESDVSTDYSCNINGTIEGQNVLLVHGDGYLEEVKITAEMISVFDSATAGNKDITITYAENKTFNATVYVGAPKANFYVSFQRYLAINTTLDTFKNNTDNTIRLNSDNIDFNDAALSITGFDTSTVGDITVTVNYNGNTGTAIITVFDPDSLQNTDLLISAGIGLAKGTDLAFTAFIKKDNDSSELIDSSSVNVVGLDNNAVGAQVVYFNYGSLTYKQVIFVYDDDTKNHLVSVSLDKTSPTGPAYIQYVNGALDLTTHRLKITHLDGTTTYDTLVESFISVNIAAIANKSRESAVISYNYSTYTFYVNTFIKNPAFD